MFKADGVTQGKRITRLAAFRTRDVTSLLRRLQREELYTATCCSGDRVTEDQPNTTVAQPANDLTFRNFIAAL